MIETPGRAARALAHSQVGWVPTIHTKPRTDSNTSFYRKAAEHPRSSIDLAPLVFGSVKFSTRFS